MLKKKSLISAVTVISLLFTTVAGNYTVSAVSAADTGSTNSLITYSQYTQDNPAVPDTEGKITVDALNPTQHSDDVSIVENIHELGKDAVVIPDTGNAEWVFTAERDCAYMLRITYAAAEKSGGNLELELEIDGKTPFKEASLISMRRTFTQSNGEFETNVAGNDIMPASEEILRWNTYDVSDSTGYTDTPFVFSLKQGQHSIKFTGSRGKVAVSAIEFLPLETVIDYAEYEKQYDGSAAAETDPIIIEGEAFSEKNSATVLPTTDRTSPATTPQSAVALKLNTVGASSWKTVGDAITWKFTADASGMYEIGIRYRQNLSDGIFASRKLYIDGKVPFSEAAKIHFDYDSAWQCEKLGDGETTYAFWLEAGEHTITLEAVSGDVSQIVSEVNAALNSLNRIYRRIVMITGSSPDVNRDYGFDELIPDEIEEMAEISDNLRACVEDIKEQAGASGSYTSIIDKLVFQIDKMTEKPRSIAENLKQFKSNLGSLSSWLLSAIEQPLEIDRIFIQPEGSELPKAEKGFFEKLAFSIKSFLASYVTDYSSIGQTEGADSEDREELTVWIQSGRDQGEIVRDLMSSTYTKEHNVTVNLKIVPTGTLLQSVIAGIAPDVAFDCLTTEPVDYALRGAVVDLTEFEDYDEVFSQFSEAAIKPARLNGGVYGMPQTFGFNMMFYRTDIFEEYGWEVPKTWTELKKLIPSLQYNGMEVGIPHDSSMYAVLLYQNGGEFYIEDGKYTNLKSNTCLESFVDFCELFTLYDSPVTFDFANRFRTGEMPLAIQNYTVYNQLIAFAPEIKGLWEMVPIPGTEDENGNINNVSVGTTTYMMLMETSQNKDTAWEFMKWYMSPQVQSDYGMRMESLLGNCAKVNSANNEALSLMAWSSSEYRNLTEQLKNVDAIPQVPGGYYLDRVLTFAFNRTYNGSEEQTMGEDPAEVLTQYVKEFNEELAQKRKEFNEVLQNEK